MIKIPYILSALALLLSACGGSREIRITEGTEPAGQAPTGSIFASSDASIVHIEMSSRIATIRNGRAFEDGAFLITQNRKGERTGILKALPNRESALRIADILEGEPEINHFVAPASPSETERLSKIYRDAEQE